MYLAFDIGGTLIKSMLIDGRGHFKTPLTSQATPKDEIEFLKALAELAQKHHSKIKGIAISTSGVLDPKTGAYQFSGNFPFMVGKNICQYLKDLFHLPVSTINDGQASLLGEIWKGRLNGVENGFLLTIGTGLVSSLVLNGKPYYGGKQMAGELSFLTLNPKENFFPVKGSALKFIEEAHVYLSGDVSQDGYYIFDKLYKGDSGLDQIFENYIYELGLLLFNIQMLLDLDKIVIAGGISKQTLLLEKIRESYKYIYKNKALEILGPNRVEIEASSLEGHGSLLGALAHHLNI